MIEGSFVKALNKEFHQQCFVCYKCGGSLADGFFGTDRPLCRKCAN
jgi:hypothetical protein